MLLHKYCYINLHCYTVHQQYQLLYCPTNALNFINCKLLKNEELNDLYSLHNIVRVVKSRRMRWEGHVACMGEDRGVHRVLVGKPEGKRPLGRPRRRWKVILRWIFRKLEGLMGTRWSWFRRGTGGGHLWVR